MAVGPPPVGTDPRWPRLLSLAAHEFRSPLTVVSGYIRMLLKERAGPVPEQQRRLLQEAEKSCNRLLALLAEVSELSQLESGGAPFNRGAIDLSALLSEVISGLPSLPDRDVTIDLRAEPAIGTYGDAVRLRAAFKAILLALRRELVTSDRLVVQVGPAQADDDRASIAIAIAEAPRIDSLQNLPLSELTTFDEWRGGCGLSLPNARRILEAHGGRIFGPADAGKAAALITLRSV